MNEYLPPHAAQGQTACSEEKLIRRSFTIRKRKTGPGWRAAAAAVLLGVPVLLSGCGSAEPFYSFGNDAEILSASLSGISSGEEADTVSGTDVSVSLSAASETEEVSQSVCEPEEPPEPIWVHVCGAVERPGVYELEPGSRVFEAIRAAGGLKEEAEDRSLNQAARLTDGEQITVFTVSEIEEQGGISPVSVNTGQESSGGAGTGGSGKVNLNTAGAEELKTLPGIGDVRAAAILLWRETNGPFVMVEDIMQVDGIKEKSFEKIKEYIEV